MSTASADPTWRPHVAPYLGEPGLDDLARMCIALSREVWVLRDRLTVAETLLEEKGVMARSEIDDHVPSEQLERELEVESDALVERVLGAPLVEAQPIDEVVETALKWSEASRTRATS